MATSVTLPALGESVTEGTVTRWLKQEGDTVEADEPLLEVSTDKVDTEIPSPAAGTLLSIKVQEDETVEVGAELAVIGDSADQGTGESGTGGGDAGAGTNEETGSDAVAAGSTADQSAEATPEATAGDAAPAQSTDAEATDAEATDAEATGAIDSGITDSVATSRDTDASTGDAESESPRVAGGGGAGGGVSVTLPALGESVTEGTVTRWLKQEGDTVEADEPLLEVSTDKVDTEIPSPVAGVLTSIKVREDETVDVGTELAVIGGAAGDGDGAASEGPVVEDSAEDGGAASARSDDADSAADDKPAAVAEKAHAEEQEPKIEASDAGAPPSGETAKGGAPQAEARDGAPQPASTGTAAPTATAAEPSPDGAAQASTGDGAYVTPLVRKLAAEAGIELGSITGTGVGGRIRKQDVTSAVDARKAEAQAKAGAEAAATATTQVSGAPAPADRAGGGTSAAPPAAAAESLRGKTVKMTRMRAFIAKRMVESLQISAQLTTVVEVDITQIARLRTQAKASFAAREGVNLSFLPFFAKASIEALRAYPQVNASIHNDTGEVTYHGAEHLGIAVDTERGLIVPVIHDAGDLNIGGLARKIAEVAERTRNNKISPDELSGGTFTLTNTGSRGALFDTPILNQPQVGILGTGAVVKRPVVIDDPRLGETIAIRSMVYLALTYDHRIVDGADAARFLTSMKQRLEEGNFESELGL